MALSNDIRDRLGDNRLLQITNFDDDDATTYNATRLAAAIEDAQGAVRRRAGLAEPSDTSSAAYDSYRELVLLGTVYYLEWYRNRHAAETAAAKTAFDEAMDDMRKRGYVALATDSVVDVSDEDTEDRRARFAPSHFNDMRINSLGSQETADEDF